VQDLDLLGFDSTSIGWILFHTRRYEEAIREFRAAQSMHRDNPWSYWFLGHTLSLNR